MKRFLIINADDYGWTSDISKACSNLVEKGALTSVSAMIGGEENPSAWKVFCDGHPSVSIGVHLNLSTGVPVSPLTLQSPLVNFQTGMFKPINLNNFRSLLLSFNKKAILHEFDAQIESIKAAVKTISHLDTHHHIARFPTIALMLASIARRHGIQRVRTPLSFASLGLTLSRRMVIETNRLIYVNRELRCPSLRFGMPSVVDWSSFESLFQLVIRSSYWGEGCWAELSCHPSLGRGVLNQSQSMEKRRKMDYELLADERFAALVKRNDVYLKSYYDL